MSVDTHLKGKRLGRYSKVEQAGVEVLVAPSLMSWAKSVNVDAKRFLWWRTFKINVNHKHRPS